LKGILKMKKRTLSIVIALALLVTPVMSSGTASATETTEKTLLSLEEQFGEQEKKEVIRTNSEILQNRVDVDNAITLSTKLNPEYFEMQTIISNNDKLLGFSEEFKNTLKTGNLNVKINLVIDGVKAVDSFAFKETPQIISVYFSNTVQYIFEYSFENCENLKNVWMTNNVTEVSRGVFWDCFSLENVVLSCYGTKDFAFSNSIERSKEKGYEGFNLTFDNRLILTGSYVNHPPVISSETLDAYNFLKFKTITFPEEVVAIKSLDFSEAEAESISFPKTLEYLENIKLPTNEDLKIITNGNDVVAKSLNGKYFSFGDSNFDERVDNADLINTAMYLLKTKTFTWKEVMSADINIDGTVDVADLAMLKQYLMGDTVGNIK
jgi:hypothetical protein